MSAAIDSEGHSIVGFLLKYFPVPGICKTQPKLNMQEYTGVTGLIGSGDRLFIEMPLLALFCRLKLLSRVSVLKSCEIF